MKNVIIKIILSAVASLLHTIGFYVLWNVRQRNPYMATQRLYLMNLSIAENFHSTFLGLYNVFYLIGHEDWGTYMFVLAAGGGFLWYMSILIMLTVDRFLTVYLNLRYLLVWNVKKTKFVLKLCFFFAFVANIFFLVYLDTYEKALRCYSIFVWFPIDNLFILVSIVTYIYILVRVLRRTGRHETPLLVWWKILQAKQLQPTNRKTNQLKVHQMCPVLYLTNQFQEALLTRGKRSPSRSF